MTRQTAHKKRYMIENMTSDDIIQDLIDAIYNGFEDQTCETCSCLQEDFNNTCSIGISIPEDMETDEPDITFGCNLWEHK